MTIWGVSSGRAGTQSLAKQLGGVHEPRPWFGTKVVEYRRHPITKREPVMEILRYRHGLGVPVVDLQHSYLIPDILEVDPEAEFIWTYRDPWNCIASFLAGGGWTDQNGWGEDLPSPGGCGRTPGWGTAGVYPRIIKAIYHWVYTNQTILETSEGLDVTLYGVEDLTERVGAWSGEPYVLSYEEKALIQCFCESLYRKIDRLKERG